MSISAYSSRENKEFLKHYEAVKFCILHKLSFPKETSEFFKGHMGGDDLEDVTDRYIMSILENGIELDLKSTADSFGNEIKVMVSDIPAEAEYLIVRLS